MVCCLLQAWPIEGGHTDSFSAKHKRDLLITGHEDGAVKFWDISQGMYVCTHKSNHLVLFAVVLLLFTML